MEYRRSGNSGLKLPLLSLGAWANFGDAGAEDVARDCILRSFDLGITHFDFANNYGNPLGQAEVVCGRILNELPRDELVISSKAGFPMWPGPYGEGGSRKHLIASCNQSLKRMAIDYFDIFYSHRPDPNTPVDETISALASLVHQGKALYVGVSSYSGERFKAAVSAALHCGMRLIIVQPYYNLLGRSIETELLPHAVAHGVGVIPFCPLASGLLTDKYLNGTVPVGSRPTIWPGKWVTSHSETERSRILQGLNEIAGGRGQSLAQMALAWTLRPPGVTSVLVGASRPKQIEENVACLESPFFTVSELAAIDALVGRPN